MFASRTAVPVFVNYAAPNPQKYVATLVLYGPLGAGIDGNVSFSRALVADLVPRPPPGLHPRARTLGVARRHRPAHSSRRILRRRREQEFLLFIYASLLPRRRNIGVLVWVLLLLLRSRLVAVLRYIFNLSGSRSLALFLVYLPSRVTFALFNPLCLLRYRPSGRVRIQVLLCTSSSIGKKKVGIGALDVFPD